MPTPSAGRPRPPQSLEGTLEQQPQQGLSADLSGFDLSQVDPFFAQAAQNLPEPDLAPVPGSPGFLPVLLSALGGGLSGDVNATTQFMNLQQNRIDEAKDTNRKLELQHKNNQIDLLLAGRKELTRKLELEERNAAAERERIRAAKLQGAKDGASLMNAITNRMKFTQGVKESLLGVQNDLIKESDHLAAQVDEWNLLAEDAFARGEAAPPFTLTSTPDANGNTQTFHSPEAMQEAFNAAVEDAASLALDEEGATAIREQLNSQSTRFFSDPLKQHAAVIKKFLRRTENQEAEVKRKTGIADRKKAAELLASTAVVTEPKPAKAKTAKSLSGGSGATRRQ